MLRRVRSGIDLPSVVNYMKGGSLLPQMALTPETRLRYDFPYGARMPPALLPDNPYLQSLVYEATSLYPPSSQQPPPSTALAASLPLGPLALPGYQDLYFKPFHAAEMVDSRLASARPSQWTTVCADDKLMTGILAVYFRAEYSFVSPFQKDYFLEDMAAQKSRFCSSLLVNAMLAYASVGIVLKLSCCLQTPDLAP